jgi:hypothetical protein
LRVPGGFAFSEFRGYEDWQLIAVAQGLRLHGLSPTLRAAAFRSSVRLAVAFEGVFRFQNGEASSIVGGHRDSAEPLGVRVGWILDTQTRGHSAFNPSPVS